MSQVQSEQALAWHFPKILDEYGSDEKEERKIWGGNPTGIINLNNVRYTKATALYDAARADFWIPDSISFQEDINHFKTLTPAEKFLVAHTISYLTFLDSVQVTNLPHIMARITAPEIRHFLTAHAFFEGIHSQAYSYMIQELYDLTEREEVYNAWRTEPILLDRCRYIATFYQKYIETQTPETYFQSLVADYLLEGLYFYHGFINFYALNARGLLPGATTNIKKINRDELHHVRMFSFLIKKAMEVFPHSKDQVYEMFTEGVRQEILWNNHVISKGTILSINSQSIEDYLYYLANSRLREIGLDPIFPQRTNPYLHLELNADTGADATSKGNFFLTKVTDYQEPVTYSGRDFLDL